MENYYGDTYFASGIFQYDYAAIARAIIEVYHPASVIEFGCGNGELSKALFKEGVTIVATDGFAQPDFSAQPGITFSRLDMNDKTAMAEFLAGLGRRFDLAICMEVAEHLDPEVSAGVVDWLTSAADTVIFSAAVPGQGGDGHINCRDRLFWHRLFQAKGYFLNDTIRDKIRGNPAVGTWFRLNTLDYVKLPEGADLQRYKALVEQLVLSESCAASMYYLSNQQMEYKSQSLDLDLIKFAFRFRNFLKRIIGKPVRPSQFQYKP